MPEPARSLQQRKNDALHRLSHDKDLWLASTSMECVPWLVALNFWWSGAELVVSTVGSNPTALNIIKTGRVRVVLGHTRDVVLIGASARLAGKQLPSAFGDAFAAKCGWDPRETQSYQFFLVTPEHIESWRELNEHADRTLMRSGRWLV